MLTNCLLMTIIAQIPSASSTPSEEDEDVEEDEEVEEGVRSFLPFSPLPFIYLQLISILIWIVILICRSIRRASTSRRWYAHFSPFPHFLSFTCN